MKTRRLTTSGVSPVEFQVMKQYLRVSHDAEDSFIRSLLNSSVTILERMGRLTIRDSVMTTSFVAPYWHYPSYGIGRPIIRDPDNVRPSAKLPRGPVREVSEVFYSGPDLEKELVDASLYRFDLTQERLIWSAAMAPMNSQGFYLNVTYSSGFDFAPVEEDAVNPEEEDIKQAIMDTVAYWYDTRGSLEVVPDSALAILSKYWTPLV